MCFSTILEKFTAKQATIMGNFAEVLEENQSKNMNSISTEIGIQIALLMKIFQHIRLRSSGVATISINPNKKSTRAATIRVNPAGHASQWPMSVERRIKIVTAVRVKLICKRPKESISHLNVRKVRQM